MITPKELVPRFSISKIPLPPGLQAIEVKYIINDLGYLSEWEEKLLVKSIYVAARNSTNYYLSNKNRQCMITIFNNNNDLEGLIEYLNEEPYDTVLRFKAFGLIK